MAELQDELESRQKRYGWPIDPYRLFLFFKNKWHWLLISLTFGLLIGAIVAKTMVAREYQATVTLTLNPEYTDQSYQLDVQSMVDAILLPSNVDEAMKRLKLKIPRKGFASLIRTDFNYTRSSLLRITATWPSMDRVAEVANTVATVFIDHQREQIKLLHEEAVRNLQTDLEIALARLDNFRQVYDSLRKEKGFADIDLETQMAIQEAARLRYEADRLASEAGSLAGSLDRSEGSTQERGAREVGGRSRSTSDNYTDLREELTQSQARLEAARSRLPPGHPTITAMEREIERLRAQLPTNRRSRGSTVSRHQYSNARAQQQALESSAARAEARLKELAQDNSEVTTLLMDIRVAERHVEELKLRLTGATDDARNPPLMFRLLAEAKPPTFAEKSRRKIVVVGFGIGSLAICTIALFVLAVWGMRIYTANEAAFWSKMPVVGSSTWPADPNMLQSLIRDLDDFAPTSSGSTLVVTALDNETERNRAQVVAQWLNQSNAFAREVAANPSASLPALRAENRETLEAHAIQTVPNPEDEQTALDRPIPITRAWTGSLPGPALRRAARLADRVMVTLSSGTVSAIQLARLPTVLGRKEGIGILMLGLDRSLADSPDRVGPVEQFWNTIREQEK